MKKILCFILFVSSSVLSNGQIKLPAGFKCSLGVNHANESYFTNGTVTFKTYPWGHDDISGQDVVTVIEDAYQQKLRFQKTKDGLYWATGKVGNKYLYIVIAENDIQFTLSSSVNGNSFSDYSIWLLKEIRRETASKKELYFTDNKGKSCFGMK